MPTVTNPPEPLWSRRAKASQAKNNSAFIEMRARQGRSSPKEWAEEKPNTTYSDKEAPLAGHTRNGEFEPRMQTRYVHMAKTRALVGKNRTTGVTKEDRKTVASVNDRFFKAAKTQERIEDRRTMK